jgi:hypothetical protein
VGQETGKKKKMENDYTGAETVGPFNRGDVHYLTYEGYKLPYLQAGQMDKDDPGNWYVEVDERIIFGPFTKETLDAMIGPLAYGMAVAAGYPCPGNAEKSNPHAVKMIGLASERPKPALSIVPKEVKIEEPGLNMPDIFTPQEVVCPNRYQRSGVFHPFTCGGDRCNDRHADREGYWLPPCGAGYVRFVITPRIGRMIL